jgi:hypothetical protein
MGGRVLGSMEAWTGRLEVVDVVASDELEDGEDSEGDGASECLLVNVEVSDVACTVTGNGAKVPVTMIVEKELDDGETLGRINGVNVEFDGRLVDMRMDDCCGVGSDAKADAGVDDAAAEDVPEGRVFEGEEDDDVVGTDDVGDVFPGDVPDAEDALGGDDVFPDGVGLADVVDVVPTLASLGQSWPTTSFEFKFVFRGTGRGMGTGSGTGSGTGTGVNRLEHCFVTSSTAFMTPWTQESEHPEVKSSFVQSGIVSLYARLQPGRSKSRAEAWNERS